MGHIPKTGGSYLNTLSNNEFPHLSFNHVLVRSDIYVPVGLTPIKREGFQQYEIRYYHHTKNFEEYINSKHYDYENAQKGFRHLVLKIINRTDKWPSKKFLFPQLFDDKGFPVVDWINIQALAIKKANKTRECSCFTKNDI